MALRVTQPFTVWIDGTPHGFSTGDLVASDHPVVKGREALFEDVDEFVVRRPIRTETAAAAPGERRSRTRTKRAAAKPGDPLPVVDLDDGTPLPPAED